MSIAVDLTQLENDAEGQGNPWHGAPRSHHSQHSEAHELCPICLSVHQFPTLGDAGVDDVGCGLAMTGGHYNPTFKTYTSCANQVDLSLIHI